MARAVVKRHRYAQPCSICDLQRLLPRGMTQGINWEPPSSGNCCVVHYEVGPLHKTETSFIGDHRCADDPAQNQNFEVTPVPSMACPVSPGCTVGVTPDQFVTAIGIGGSRIAAVPGSVLFAK